MDAGRLLTGGPTVDSGQGCLALECSFAQQSWISLTISTTFRHSKHTLLSLSHLTCPLTSQTTLQQKAKIEPNPCSLRATATPSCLGTMDFEQEGLAAELKSYQTVFGRFTFSWKKWWGLNRYHFEMSECRVCDMCTLYVTLSSVAHVLIVRT